MAMPVVVMAMSVAAWPLLLGCWLVPESGLDIYNLHPPKFDIDTKTDGFQDLVPEELYVWDNFSKRGIWCPNLPELLEPFLQDWKTYGFYTSSHSPSRREVFKFWYVLIISKNMRIGLLYVSHITVSRVSCRFCLPGHVWENEFFVR